MNPSTLDADKIVCLTFDDLWKSQVDFCFPALKEYGFLATFFVSDETFSDHSWHGRLASCLTWRIRCQGEKCFKVLQEGFLVRNPFN